MYEIVLIKNWIIWDYYTVNMLFVINESTVYIKLDVTLSLLYS